MVKLLRFWKIILLDTLGVLLMIGAILTGWLPGPTGVPMFILGLSLLAIHHEWAERYINIIKKYANRASDYIFVNNPGVQFFYDCIAPLMIGGGVYSLWRHDAVWMISAGIFLTFTGLTILLGNRQRLKRLKSSLRR
jgi:hypothetical protein